MAVDSISGNVRLSLIGHISLILGEIIVCKHLALHRLFIFSLGVIMLG